MSYFSTYEPYAIQAANQYSIPVPIFNSLIQQESSWNPYASPGTTSAYGLTQLTTAAANQVGANPFDPISNLYGGAAYLASMPGNNWTTKLAHYFQGPNATINSSGLNYANQILGRVGGVVKSIGDTIKNELGLGDIAKTGASAAACIGGDPLACAGVLGIGSGATDWVTEIKNWISSTGFFQRIALALVALLLILGAIYTLKDK